jgi:Ras-related protein Rab-43
MSRLPSNTVSEESFDFLFKIVVIGDCGIGKTSLVQRFKSGVFTERYTNTIGVDFAMKTVVIEGKQVKVCNIFIKLLIITIINICF